MGGREFDPNIDYYAPPCTPGTPGAALPSNGGATAQGVTANSIEVVWFATNYGAVVNAILQAEGLYETAGNIMTEAQYFENFINTKYVLWGRKIHVDVFNSQCTAAPPDTQCLNSEIDSIQAKYHPYALLWDTTVCSSCYAEMAKDGMIGVGGFGFTDSFANALAPYFYSPGESSTRTVEAFAQFYCNQLAGNPTAFAGDHNPAQTFNGKPRSLGVITPNDPDNINAVEKVLEPALDSCGVGNQVRQHHYYYSQDPSRTAIESQQAISAMGNTSTTPATTVLCLCDPVAPAFTYGREQNENYWPEAIIASDQGMDDDIIGRSYESGTGCTGSPCEFDKAFGLSTVGPQLPPGKDPGYRVYAAGGGTGTPPVTALTADRDWATIELVANLVENTGPDLTPARMQAAAPTLGIRGGGSTGYAAEGFAQGDYQETQDARIVYYDNNAVSGYDGAKGAYVQEAGTPRYNLGQYPKTGNPNFPAR
ncbi:MAG TPA: hypothetical protein VFP61_03510 [Acidimicrobiales bacterium]|nr:hypothetical protein [Acidimicrobiales bacterium]